MDFCTEMSKGQKDGSSSQVDYAISLTIQNSTASQTQTAVVLITWNKGNKQLEGTTSPDVGHETGWW